MLPQIKPLGLIKGMGESDFKLSSIPDFPYTQYTSHLAQMQAKEKWFTGEALDEEVDAGDVDIYPLKWNPIKRACWSHAQALFGENPDNRDVLLVQPRVYDWTSGESVPSETTEQEHPATNPKLERVENALEMMWYENNGSAILMQGGISSQIKGGTWYRLAYVPWDETKQTGIRIDVFQSEECIAVVDPSDYFNVYEVWVVREIDAKVAVTYGIEVPGDSAYWIEHWTRSRYSIWINDSPILYDVMGDSFLIDGPNPWGFVPFVYIPHARSTQFLGDSQITEGAIGITKELNLRIADAGDATSDETHQWLIMKNTSGTPRIVRIGSKRAIDLGTSKSVVSGSADPDMKALDSNRLTSPIMDLIRQLYVMFRREMSLSGVAEGEDEGSQRSGETLFARMWVLLAHVKMERVFWNAGLRRLHYMALAMMIKKNRMEIVPDDLRYRLAVQWFPILPRERKALMDELAIRAANNIGSLELLMELAGDVDDITAEMQRIRAWREFEADMEAKKFEAQAEARMQQQEQSQNANSTSKRQSDVQR